MGLKKGMDGARLSRRNIDLQKKRALMRGAGWRFWGLCIGAGVLSILTGCASVTHGTTQSVKIETLTPEGKTINGAKCAVTNDRNDAAVRSGDSFPVRRSGANLMIECTQPGQLPATGQAFSRVNAGMVGNIMIGGALGAVIDSSTGAGFNYPSWMRLVFGEVRNFDRSAQNGDEPTDGVRIGKTEVATAAPSAPSALSAPSAPKAVATNRAEEAPAQAPVPTPVAAPALVPLPAPVAVPAPPPVARAEPPQPRSDARVSMEDLRGLLPAKP
jgi:hypothetical protein